MNSRFLTPETRSCSNAELARKLRGEVSCQEPLSNLVAEALARVLSPEEERCEYCEGSGPLRPGARPTKHGRIARSLFSNSEREKAKLASPPVEEHVLTGAAQFLDETRATLDKPVRPFARIFEIPARR